ncbi:N-acetyltransferase [Sporosarcina sp. Marseille-Q4943]|uniref:GNAT family N-acetyltransferase n=1 Tax=Sporosarcina sp. Marseille-Q4943 TaxID=2942204 RepID=UPI00208DC467|nr:GNAT family N-acetyltransferase [Sporosarcina sp. Marseille-Q4943]
MNNVLIAKMNSSDFEVYYEDKLIRYAEVLEENIHEVGDSGESRAKQQLASLLPKGFYTNNHCFYNIYLNDLVIGYVWMKLDSQKRSAFLYEIYILEDYRSKGYGKQVMTLIEQVLVDEAIIYFKLHVFGSNQKALKFYEEIEFEVFGINMVKNL